MNMRLVVIALVIALGACSDAGGEGGVQGQTEAEVTTDAGTRGENSGPGSGFQSADELGAEATPTAILFGILPLGEVDTRFIEVLHTGGSGTLELVAIRYVAESGSDISLELPELTRLEPGESTRVGVRFQPTDAIQDTGVVEIETNTINSSGAALVLQIPIDTTPPRSDVLSDLMVVAFGGVETATTESRELVLANIGSLDVSITSVTIEEASGEDFSVTVAGGIPHALGFNGTLPLEVHYTPTGFDTDTAIVKVVYSAADGGGDLIVPVNGSEISAELKVTPSPLDFGLRAAGEAHVETLTITSQNNAVPLRISDVALVELGEWSDTITIEPWPEEGRIIGPDESLELEVTFTPTEGMVAPPTPIAELAFSTNDPSDEGVQTLSVYGQRSGTGLEVFPPDIVYFGYVGVGGQVTREVTLYNAGNAPVNVESVNLEGDFSILNGDDWPPTDSPPLPATLEPGEPTVVTVRFFNAGPPLETTWGKLIIVSDHAAMPEWEVLLNVQKVEGGACLLQFTPSAIDYGMVPPWTQHTQSLSLVNIGSSVCHYHSAITDDCEEVEACEVSPDAEMAASTSVKYAVTAEPEAGTEIQPGEVVSVEVTFDAPDPEPAITPHPGMVRARVTSLDGQTGEEVTTVHPSASSWLNIPNLLGSVGVGQFEVSPPVLDFQLVEIGCVSPPTVVTGSNVGLAPLEVSEWWLEGCTEEVRVLEAPEPEQVHELGMGQSLTWTFDYGPVDESTDTCTLFIVSSDSQTPTEVSVTGIGAYPAEVVDLFTDSEAQKVDVLFVVDDSGSMTEEQGNLSDSFEAFIYEAASWDSDYQIGVTTTTVSLLELSGGVLFGSPPWVTNANWEKFVNIVEVGVTGSGTEQGIWSAFIATGETLNSPPAEACEADHDCGLNRGCVEGLCQGLNYGFFREDAALEIVFVSDEDDQSPAELEEYLNHFRGIKGYDHPELLHMHAIVGPPGGCSSANGSADAGLRYMNMAEATGGAMYSICELDFAKGLEGIGEIAFAAKMEYTLSQIPAPTTISVTIEGLPCPNMTGGIFNWVYDAEDNTVTLTEEGICIAGSGDEVLITYDLLCYAEAD